MLNGCLPDTDYFELEASSGRRYGVWVTVPASYASGDEALPLMYVLDGNFAVGLTAPLIVSQSDPYLSIAPYIQVSVGYAGEEAAAWATLRNRDLVPPGEPTAPDVLAALEAARDAGTMSQEHVDAYLAELQDTQADVFLTFLIEELHPRLQAKLRVAESGHGLFGYSYGGLFALYAWLSGPGPFSTVGAGSPGVLHPDSLVYRLVAGLPTLDAGAVAAKLHVTLNEAEVLGAVPVYRGLSQNVLQVLEQLYASGRSHVISTEMLGQTHVTGLQASFLSYLRHCHVR